MINVFIVDLPQSLGDFLNEKLSEEKINVSFMPDKIDSFPKMLSHLPDLVITNMTENENIENFNEYLKKIKGDINASKIPLFVLGPKKELKEIAEYAKLRVHKYFMKPLKLDFLFETIGQALKTQFTIDTTPCIIDVHCNGNIIFVEISQGLNRDKIALLRYKIAEIIENIRITTPRIFLLISNLDMTYVDAINVELLLNKILDNKLIQRNNLRILTNSNFMKDLIEGHTEYTGVETSVDISKFATSLAAITNESQVQDVVVEKILLNTEQDFKGVFDMRFSTDANMTSSLSETLNNANDYLKQIAIVNPDVKILDIFSSAFRMKNMPIDTFTNGILFLEKMNKTQYDLVIIDITIQNPNGFEILKKLQSMPCPPQIFVYSPPVSKEMMIKAFSLGAKQYFIKPQPVACIVEKAVSMFAGK